MVKEQYNKRKYILMFIIFIVCGLKSTTAFASSATLTFSSETKEIAVGDTFSVVLTVSSSDMIEDVDAYIAYDKSIMKYKSGGSLVSGGKGLLHISDFDTDDISNTKKYSMKFKALKEGACEVSLGDKPIIYSYEEEGEMSVSSNRLSISIVKDTRSKDTKLASLQANPGTLTPDFQVDKKEYHITVPNSTTKVAVFGEPGDKEATVSVSGNENLQEGDNTIVVSVMAPSGDKEEYKIITTKEKPKRKSDKEDDNETEQGDEFLVTEKEGSTFIENKYVYQIVDMEEGTVVPEGYVKTKLLLYGVSINVYILEHDLENNFMLMYCMNEDGETGFYQYDRIEKTLQRFSGEMVPRESYSNVTPKIEEKNEYNDKLTELAVVIGLLSALCALLIIGMISMFLRFRGYNDDDLD